MSDQGSGFPPERIEDQGARQEDWKTVPPASVGAPPPPPLGYPPPPPGWGVPEASAGLSMNAAAALSYVFVVPAIVFLLLEPYKRNDFVRFHAWQCLALFAVDVVARFVLPLAAFMGTMLYILLWLTVAAFWLYAMLKAYQGERYHVPGVGDLAETLVRSVQL